MPEISPAQGRAGPFSPEEIKQHLAALGLRLEDLSPFELMVVTYSPEELKYKIAEMVKKLGVAAEMLLYIWRGWWARPKQLAPEGDWATWLLRAGRGFGKTRTGSSWVHERAMAKPGRWIALIAANPADARDYMIEGPGGFLKNTEPRDRPIYEVSKRRLTWPNTSWATVYSDEEPDQCRGFSGDTAWLDEFAKYKNPRETWDNLAFGMREASKDRPRRLITTTPRPITILMEIEKMKSTVTVVGSSLENRGNLAEEWFVELQRYKGTRTGRQELEAEYLTDAPGALWTRALIEKHRIPIDKLPQMQRVVVGVDPSGTDGSEDNKANQVGIVCCGLGVDGLGYVLADNTCSLSPAGWGRRVVETFDVHDADLVVAEKNYGGSMVEFTLRTVNKNLPLRMVNATHRPSMSGVSRGKVARAEPVASLYEQGRIKHVGSFPEMEDQQCLVKGTLVETLYGQRPIEQIRPGDLVLTRDGFAPVVWAGQTGVANELVELITPSTKLRATRCHPVLVEGRFVPAGNVSPLDPLLVRLNQVNMDFQLLGVEGGIIGKSMDTSTIQRLTCYTERFIGRMLVLFQKATISTISMMILGITALKDWSALHLRNITLDILPVVGMQPLLLSGENGQRQFGLDVALENLRAQFAVEWGKQRDKAPDCIAQKVVHVKFIGRVNEPVYNLKIRDGFPPEYFANGILVHNCMFLPDGYTGEGSPDRVDAMVWAFTELLLKRFDPMSGMTVALPRFMKPN